MTSYKDYVYGFSALGGAVTLAATAVLHGLAWCRTPDVMDLFHLERHAEWRAVKVNVIGVPWLMWIWASLYLVQLVWMLYGFSFLCRQTALARLLYPTLPPVVHVTFLSANLALVGWLFVWDEYRLIHWALLCLLATAILAPFTMLLMLKVHKESCPRLHTLAPLDYWLLRALAHNGVAVHGTWAAILVLYQIAVVITDHTTIPIENVHQIFLGQLIGYIIFWFICDLVVSRHFHSWVVSPYVIFLIFSIGMLVHRGSGISDTRLFMTAICIILSIVFGLAKTWNMSRQQKDEYSKAKMKQVVITRLEKEQLDKMEKIDMINKMFEY